MATPVLPRAQSAMAGRELPATTWYDFFRDLLAFVQANEGNTAQIEAILARLDELEENQPGQFTIAGLMSVEVDGSPQDGGVQVHLLNDTDAPGNLYYYRTGIDGTKGWEPILPGEVPTDLATYLVDEAGNFLDDGSGQYLASDQPDALMTDLTWSSDSDGLHVTGSDGLRQTLVANNSKIVTVYALSDLPAAVAGVITLASNTSYYITAAIDLLGARLQCGSNVGLFGDSAANCSLTSTGLGVSTALITSASALNMESITLHDVDTCLDLNDATSQLNWENIVFQNIPTIGVIQNYANLVWGQCLFDNAAGLTIQGTIGSIAFFECLFDGRTGATTLTIPASAVITRRIRMLYCAVACLPGETAFNVSTSATIPDEGYILDNVAFAGGGTFLAGLDYTSNKALFFNCVGINNSSTLCQYSMTGNATATVIATPSTFVKVAGVTVPSSLNQKFSTAVDNRATYAGAFTSNFRIVAFASMTSGNNQTLRMRVAKNGTTIAESNTLFKTTGSGEASAVGCQVITSLAPGDYVELWVANDSAVQNITVSDLNFTITRL